MKSDWGLIINLQNALIKEDVMDSFNTIQFKES